MNLFTFTDFPLWTNSVKSLKLLYNAFIFLLSVFGIEAWQHEVSTTPLSFSRCSYQNDKYQTTMVPVELSSGLLYPSHYKRFILKMFTFVDHTLAPRKDTVIGYLYSYLFDIIHTTWCAIGFSLTDFMLYSCQIFIHCSGSLCYPTPWDSCEPKCNKQSG